MTDIHESFLRFIDDTGRRHELTLTPDHQRITIGRSPQADLSLGWDAEVSRLHAAVEYLGAHWTIVDDGLSRNGTFVNGERLAGRRRLEAGDRIRVGTSTLSFHDYTGTVDDATRTSVGSVPSPRSLTDTQRAVLIALCRPYRGNTEFATPASNQQIADELYLSVDAIKTHLRALFSKFGVEDLPQNQKRVRLAALAIQNGIISHRDL
ncbi:MULTISPECIES: FHA domain-containing protein [Nocardia]|uniref:FHA domain-containing protein n=1 Tax=Nocardia TaxID=1817 RepID=UPI0004C2D63B|nr:MULTISPECIES: FHA domain-containing protein [Nocardia]MBF6144460.1 FHA domain-containing protein [Nocardia nova]MDN2497854.1 FHA domain-containing protein [Nocardia nova]PPJ18481.1 LuxR family transcriptional regulator [Nocardia nova]